MGWQRDVDGRKWPFVLNQDEVTCAECRNWRINVVKSEAVETHWESEVPLRNVVPKEKENEEEEINKKIRRRRNDIAYFVKKGLNPYLILFVVPIF